MRGGLIRGVAGSEIQIFDIIPWHKLVRVRDVGSPQIRWWSVVGPGTLRPRGGRARDGGGIGSHDKTDAAGPLPASRPVRHASHARRVERNPGAGAVTGRDCKREGQE